MSLNGCDIDWGKPPGSALASAGFKVASLYVGQDTTGKNMTPAVVNDYTSHGISVITNFEYGAQQMLGGAAQGIPDARLGISQARACGMPGGRPIYYSADWAVSSAQMPYVLAYLSAARSVTGPGTVGVYGPYSVVQAAHDYWRTQFPGEKIYLWQTVAWSGGLIYPGLDMYQDGTTRNVGGVTIDYDSVLSSDAGQWPPPVIQNTPHEEPEMILLTGMNQTDVYALSGSLYWHVVDGTAVSGYKAAGVPEATIDATEHAAILAAVSAAGSQVSLTDAQVASLGQTIAANVHFPTHLTGSVTETVSETLS